MKADPLARHRSLKAAALCAAAVAWIAPSCSAADAPERRLPISGSIDVRSLLSGAHRSFAGIRGLAVGANRLYVLGLSKPTNTMNSTLVALDLDGSLLWTKPMGPAEVTDLSSDSSGVVTTVSLPLEGATLVTQFDPDGRERMKAESAGAVRAASLADGALATLAAEGSAKVATASGAARTEAIESARVGDSDIRPLGDRALAIVDRYTPTITLIDGDRKTTPADALTEPHIRDAKAEYDAEEREKPGIRGITITMSASNRQNLFLMVSRFRPQEGETVLKLDAAGKVLELLRLSTPYECKRPVVPLDMAAGPNCLYVLDDTEKVSFYSL